MATVRISVRPGGLGWEVHVETPDGREFLRGARRLYKNAFRLAKREEEWWRRNAHPVSLSLPA